MKILFVIPHYYKYNPESIYGSGREATDTRVQTLQNTITALKNRFSSPTSCGRQIYKNNNYGERSETEVCVLYEPADTEAIYETEIALCTNTQDHLVGELDLPPDFFRHEMVTISDPRYLGFACHQILKRNLGKYDYYCYMEDDLVIHDRDFFHKLAWFEHIFGAENLLQPHRYMENGKPFFKQYLDAELDICMDDFIDFADGASPELSVDYLGSKLKFLRTHNPHAGCFFLSAKQYEMMCARVDYGQPNKNFFTPLESAATWDLLKTFKIYRVTKAHGWFLEIEHTGKSPAVGPANRKLFNRQAFARYGFEFC